MRILEALSFFITPLLAAGGASWGWLVTPCALHMLAELPRWQMYPAYAGLALLLAGQQLAAGWLRMTVLLLSTVAAALGGYLAWLVPVPKLPKLSGKHCVGSCMLGWEDEDREFFVGQEDGRLGRPLMAQVWYPCVKPESSAAVPVPYWHDVRRRAPEFAKSLKMPAWAMNHLARIKARAYNLPSVADGDFPVIIFSHGYSGTCTQNVVMCEDLASRGFVVAAIEHTGDAQVTALPDGRMVPFLAAADEGWTYDSLLPLRQRQLQQRCDDLHSLLHELRRCNDSHPLLRGHMQTKRVGVCGQSFGGGTAAAIAAASPDDFAAAFTLDGWWWPLEPALLAGERAVPMPMLVLEAPRFMGEEKPTEKDNRAQTGIMCDASPQLVTATVQGSRHLSYTDMSIIAPRVLKKFGLLDVADGWPIQRLLVDAGATFFAGHLRGEDATAVNKRVEELLKKTESVVDVKRSSS